MTAAASSRSATSTAASAELEALLARPAAGAPATRSCFVGDYIDRGPDSARVIDLLLDLGAATDMRDGVPQGQPRGHVPRLPRARRTLGRGVAGQRRRRDAGAATASMRDAASRGARSLPCPTAHLAFLDALAAARTWTRAISSCTPASDPASPLDGAGRRRTCFWIREEFIAAARTRCRRPSSSATRRSASVLVDLPVQDRHRHRLRVRRHADGDRARRGALYQLRAAPTTMPGQPRCRAATRGLDFATAARHLHGPGAA